MKNLKKIFIYFLFIGILTSFFTFSSEVPQEMKDWLLEHPEFVDGNFYYVDEDTNQEIKKSKWYYYDIKDKKLVTGQAML
jgi:hypothetical protein